MNTQNAVVAELVEREGRSEERDLRRALHLKSGDLDLALASLENVGRILPNTRIVRTTFRVR